MTLVGKVSNLPHAISQSFRQYFLLMSAVLFFGCSSSAQQPAQTTTSGQQTDSIATDSVTKVIALLGDSMTWIGGDDCEKDTGWSYYLKRHNPTWSVETYARSGATWTNTAVTKGDVKAYSAILDNENVIYNQVRRLIEAVESNQSKTPNMIVVFAGGNDAMFSRRRPGMYNTVALPEGSVENCHPSKYTSLASSVELGCRLLREHFPDARILLVTPTEMSKVAPSAVNQVGDVIENTGKKLGIEVLRADKNINIRHNVEKIKPHKYTYDGIHSNPEGAKLIATYIIGNIEN